MSRAFIVLTVVMLTGAVVATQRQLPPGYVDPAPILAAARKAIGTDSLRCVTIAGTAYAGALGQARESARNIDWPRIDSLANYTRTMNWDTWTMKEEFDRRPGLNPAGWKYGIGWEDGPLQKNPHQVFMVSPAHAWYMDGAGAPAVALPPDIAEIFPVELVLNPHGFLKAAALPGANPKAVWRWELGEMGRDGPEVLLALRADAGGFRHAFSFRAGGPGRHRFRIVNAGASSYPAGWEGYRVCSSDDGKR